jgi:16S rRNA (cytidine1402-2'-O)-methyltransferase
VSIDAGTLYVVATPIGNLGDMSPRAVAVLSGVARIAAEDTRHSAVLLRHFGIGTPVTALHEHNERQAVEGLVERLRAGEALALISDAGTPLISDPGYHLVRAVHAAGLRVVPIPGPSAVMAALSASGLATDQFLFVGFLPSKAGPRRAALEGLAREPRTLVLFEAPHRVAETLVDLAAVFGEGREATLARELTKTFETVRRLPLGALRAFVAADTDQQRGEVVLVVAGAPAEEPADGLSEAAKRVAAILAEELPLKQAAALTARLTEAKRNRVYQHLLDTRGNLDT